ncbi:hypothetical protein HDR70_05665 [bacterium]|nr:hypothetical protein [bacterium]
MKPIIKIVLGTVCAIAIIWGAYAFFFASKDSVIVGKGKINKVDTMVELCSIDFYNEVPIIDTVQNWECFAKQKQRGSISFDIENLEIDSKGDSVYIILPPEIIEIMESTDDKAWETVDSKDLRWLRTSKAPIEVWTTVKKNALNKSKKNLYQAGIVERARAEGAENLQILMEKVYQKPVKVSDPTPKGAHFDEYK